MKEMEEGMKAQGGMHFTAHSAVYSLVVVVVAFLPFLLRLSSLSIPIVVVMN